MTTEEQHPEWVIDPGKPNVARMYDYFLGGKDHYAADREAAEQVLARLPHAVPSAQANRRFLAAAVTLLAQRGVRQFLDIGSGLPTQENVHEVAHRAAPESRVIYVDNDPVVLAHARALLADEDRTTVIQADLRDPGGIVDHPEVRARIDFDRPVGLLMLAILHFIVDDAQCEEIVARLREPLAAGSHLVISHGYSGQVPEDVETQVRGTYGKTTAGDAAGRTHAGVMRFFEGCEVLPPGLVPVQDWHPDADFFEPDLTRPGVLAAIGRVVR